MYHQTNLDCKSFNISEDLAETIVVWPWTSQNYISEWYSGWWWCITILSLTDHRYCPGNIHWSSEPSLWPWPWIQQSNLFTRHSSLWTCTVKLSWSPPKKNQQFRTYNTDSHIWLYEPKFSYSDLDLEDINPFFAYDALAYNDVSPYWLWLQMVQRCIRYLPN